MTPIEFSTAGLEDSTRPTRTRRIFIAAVLLAHLGLVWHLTRVYFATIDETGHIPAGLHHWQHGTFELYRVNPPLPRMIATLPAWALNPNFEFGSLRDTPGRRLEWSVNNRFAQNNKDRYVEIVRLARLAGIAWSLLGAWLVMRWSSELFGQKAGLLALILWCFGPNVLAYAQLVTPDIPSTVAGLATCYVFRNYLRNPSWSNAWFAGLTLGAGLLTRSTWLILFGLWPVLAVGYWWRRPLLALRARSVLLGQIVAIFALGMVVLNLGYGFQGTGRPLGEFAFVSKAFAGERSAEQTSGNRFRGSFAETLPLPLPADYVLGIDLQRADFEANWPFYIDGQWERGGRWWFYLYALLLKIPLGTLGLFLIAVILIVTGRGSSWREEMFLWLPALTVLVVVSSQTGLNYFRYILPMLPFVLIGISRCALVVTRATWRLGAAVVLLAGASIASSLSVYPHSLSYFNEAAGGPEQGHRHLVDSNIDWGQDLLYLKQWLAAHPEHGRIGLAYFNHVDPGVLGIDYELPPAAPRPGLYAVSVHFVQGGSFFAFDGKGNRRFVPLGRYSWFERFRPVAKAGATIWICDVRADGTQ